MISGDKEPATPKDLYLDLLAKTLTRALFEDNDEIVGLGQRDWGYTRRERAENLIAPLLERVGRQLVRKRAFDAEARANGRDWPARAESMAGLRRMTNARHCIEAVLADEVPGDIIETGVWRGGMSIFMRGVLRAHNVIDRTVWLADSFRGSPAPDAERFPGDEGMHLEQYEYLAAGVDLVRRNFERYGLYDDQVKFLVGWFKDTLPDAPVERLAVLRLDGDLYESTVQALESLYPKLQPGGFCIVDDYGAIRACRQAVHDYRDKYGIADEIIDIDGWGAYWRRTLD